MHSQKEELLLTVPHPANKSRPSFMTRKKNHGWGELGVEMK